MKTQSSYTSLGIALIFLLVLACKCSSGSGLSMTPPTESEVKKALETYYTSAYLSETEKGFGAESIKFEFGYANFGSPVEKAMGFGETAKTVIPVRIKFKFTVSYGNKEPKVYQRGENETFYFFKNGFDEWTFKTGS